MSSAQSVGPGTVYLVGAGPGDPGFITVRGAQCLALADVVLVDYLVNPAILEHAPPDAEVERLGHHSVGRKLTPDEIVQHMIAQAKLGKTVVRLKGGDPFIFGRGGDETAALREAGVPFEVVPGITAALAVAASCEIPITHHEDSSSVTLITGRERDAKEESHLNQKVLAELPGTLIIYMGVRTAQRWSTALMENGKPADTPVAIVRWVTRASQQTVKCTLGTVVDVIGKEGIHPPALFVIGKVVDHSPQLSWFAERPLFGARILVAGSPTTSQRLRTRLASLGADALLQPAIRITDPADWASVDVAIEGVTHYHWLIFASGNAIDFFFKRLSQQGHDLRHLGGVRIAAIGAGTVERLNSYHVLADLTPGKFDAGSLAQELIEGHGGWRFLLPGAIGRQSILRSALEAHGAEVRQIGVYDSVDITDPDPDIAIALASDEIDWITVTSSTTAESLARCYGDELKRARIASISPLTSKALRKLGFEPAFEASPHTTRALIEGIVAARK